MEHVQFLSNVRINQAMLISRGTWDPFLSQRLSRCAWLSAMIVASNNFRYDSSFAVTHWSGTQSCNFRVEI
jgi:hypothetical protein